MAQTFPPSTNIISRASIILAVVLAGVLVWVLARFVFVPATPEQPPQQPVPFIHRNHVMDRNIDCRYCHTSVEDSSFAGIPATSVCMNCHAYILTDNPILEPVRESFRTGTPLQWNRVYNLADFAYFDHSIHVQKGVSYVTCHGEVDQATIIEQAQPYTMEWCLECHRAPERFIRPRAEVFNAGWEPAGDQIALGRELVDEYSIRTEQLLDCSVCHR
jgi:hypothetical protein